jgi:hypothetical protein
MQIVKYNNGYVNGILGVTDYPDGYSLESDGILYDPNDNIVASDVISYDPATQTVTYTGGNTETIAQINASGGTGSNNNSGSGSGFFSGNTPLYIGLGLIGLSFFIED